MIATRRKHLLTALTLAALGIAVGSQAQLDATCTVSALNRTARVDEAGVWVLPNVPANTGRVRVRATCVADDGTVRSGQSDFFAIQTNGIVPAPEIVFDEPEPVPATLELTSPVSALTTPGQVAQLTATATYADGSTAVVTPASAGTDYRSSNPAIASVSDDGALTAHVSGNVLVSALNEGALAVLRLSVVLSGDSDGDGLPDDFELANGLDPNNPFDVLDDQDGDGLATGEEFDLGLDPFDEDTDDDGLFDGEEVSAIGTDPLLFDTDGDGISDGLEISTGSDPLDPTSFNLSAVLDSLEVFPAAFDLVFNTAVGEASRRLEVTGVLVDGTTLDLRSTSYGTTYASSDLVVASFGAEDGRVFAGQDGTAVVTVSVGGLSATSEVTVTTFAPTALSVLGLSGFPNGVDVDDGYAYVASGGAGLHVVDVFDPEQPLRLATVSTPGNANDVHADGRYAYVADGGAGLVIVDAADPSSPFVAGRADTPGVATDVVVDGDLAFVADGSAGVTAVDVTDRESPQVLGTLDTPGNARGIDTADGLVVVADAQGGVLVIDATDPAAMVLLGSTHTRAGFSRAADVEVRGRTAYVADGAGSLGGLRVVDFSQPATPVVTGSTEDGYGLVGVALEDNFAATADYFFVNAVPLFDVGLLPPPFTAVLDFSGTPSFRDDNGNGVAVEDGVVYMVGVYRSIRDNGTWGWGRLHIGRYRQLQDLEGVAPTVELVEPGEGATVKERRRLSVVTDASDDIRVVSVRWRVDGVVVAEDFRSPFEAEIEVPSGVESFTLEAEAVDLAGNVGLAEPRVVTVLPDAEPVVDLVSPVAGSQPVEGGPVTLAASASDDGAVVQVDLYVGGGLVASVEAPPYEASYSIPLGTAELAVEAVATDDIGQTASSGVRTVAVKADEPPTVALVEPADGAEVVVGSRVPVQAGASDDIGVTRVRFFLDGDFFGEDFEAPYETEVTAPTAVGESFTVSAVAEDTRGRQVQADATLVTVPDPGTTVTGRVLLPDGAPAVGAEVVSAGLTATSGADGGFSIAGVPTLAGDVSARATLALDGTLLVGFSEQVPPVLGGVTEVGDVLLFPGFPNGNGGFETGDFTGWSVTGATSVVSGLGPLAPTEGGFMAYLSTGFGSVSGTTSTVTTDPISIPAGVSFLAFDVNFLSDEFPTFVGSIYNDTLVVRMNVEGEPGDDQVLASVNTASFVEAPGTGFNGMTGFATVRLDVSGAAGTPETCSLTFEIRVFDQGDSAVDSAALVDNLRFE